MNTTAGGDAGARGPATVSAGKLSGMSRRPAPESSA